MVVNAATSCEAVYRLPAMVQAGLNRCVAERHRVDEMPRRTFLESALRAERLARIARRECRWWAVLERWMFSGQDAVPLVFGRAVTTAGSDSNRRARFWEDSAAEWRRRAAGEQLCGVIGCGCGGECGVPA